MRKRTRSVLGLLLIALVAISCGENRGNEGDLAPVLAQKAKEYGARLSLTNELPVLRADWTMREDENGFECIVRGTDYNKVESAIFKIFGNSGEKQRPPSGPRSCLFKASEIGVALIAIDKANKVQINCLRGMTNMPGVSR